MPSIAEIARCAEVSRCAASQILNKSRGYQRFSPELQQRVQSIAEELGWARDSRGLALQQGKTGVLALYLRGQGRETGLFQKLISAIERAARKHDQYLQIIGGTVDSAVQAVHSNRCDGVMTVGWNVNGDECKRLQTCNHVSLCHVPEGLSGVTINLQAGLTRAVTHLHSLGHKRILWMYANINGGHQERWDVIRKTAQKFGMRAQRLSIQMSPDLGEDEAAEVATMRALIKQELSTIGKYTAVICFNELMAISLYGACLGTIQIPQDLSVIGVDDIYAPLAVPPMTSVSFNLNNLAEEAVLRLLRNKTSPPVHTISSGLSIRESTSKVLPDAL